NLQPGRPLTSTTPSLKRLLGLLELLRQVVFANQMVEHVWPPESGWYYSGPIPVDIVYAIFFDKGQNGTKFTYSQLARFCDEPMADEIVKLNLRLPKDLHKRLQKAAKQKNVSLNTQIINELEGGPRFATEEVKTFMKEAVEVSGVELWKKIYKQILAAEVRRA